MKKGDISVSMIYKIILILVAVTAALLILALIKGKGESLISEIRNLLSIGG